jgi:hypothetical protein
VSAKWRTTERLFLNTRNVRFGSLADICSAKGHVRFAPNSDRESEFPQTVMSALPPTADMCGAAKDVRFGPIADIGKAFTSYRLEKQSRSRVQLPSEQPFPSSANRREWKNNPFARRVRTETPFLMVALRTNTSPSLITALRSKRSFRIDFLDVFTDAVDDVTNAIDIGHDAGERFPDLTEVRRLLV